MAERGIDRVRVSRKRKAWIRWAAVVGAINMITFVTYNLPMPILGAHGGPFPEDVLKRSYFTNGLCGPGSDYACPGSTVPMARRDSAHLDPEGKLVPAGKQCRLQACAGVKPE